MGVFIELFPLTALKTLYVEYPGAASKCHECHREHSLAEVTLWEVGQQLQSEGRTSSSSFHTPELPPQGTQPYLPPHSHSSA